MIILFIFLIFEPFKAEGYWCQPNFIYGYHWYWLGSRSNTGFTKSTLWLCERFCRSQSFEDAITSANFRLQDNKCVCGFSKPGINVFKDPFSTQTYTSRVLCGINVSNGTINPADQLHVRVVLSKEPTQIFVTDRLQKFEGSHRTRIVNVESLNASPWKETKRSNVSNHVNELSVHPTHGNPEKIDIFFKIGDLHNETLWTVEVENFPNNLVSFTSRRTHVQIQGRKCDLITTTSHQINKDKRQVNLWLKLNVSDDCNSDLSNVTAQFITTDNLQFVACRNNKTHALNPSQVSFERQTLQTIKYDIFYVDSEIELMLTYVMLQSNKKQGSILVNVQYNKFLMGEREKKILQHFESFDLIKPKVSPILRWNGFRLDGDLPFTAETYSNKIRFCNKDKNGRKAACMLQNMNKKITVRDAVRNSYVVGTLNGLTYYKDSYGRIQRDKVFLHATQVNTSAIEPPSVIEWNDNAGLTTQFKSFYVSETGISTADGFIMIF